MKTLKDRLEYSASGKNGFMACETCAEALDAITRLQGEARVMLDLLSEALGIIQLSLSTWTPSRPRSKRCWWPRPGGRHDHTDSNARGCGIAASR